jgi:hypothetical protein
MSAMHPFTRRSAVALTTAGLLCLFTMGGGAAAIGSKGIKGDPQPELKPFNIGKASGAGGNVAIESNGDLVVAYGVATPNAAGATTVCVLKRGGHTCTEKTVLHPPAGYVTEDVPQVYAPSKDHVVVLQETSGTNPNSDLLYTSTDGGATFGPPVRVGSVAVVSSALVGSNIVFTSTNAHIGWQVESVSDTATTEPPSTAVLSDLQPASVALSGYKGGVFSAADYFGKVEVKYAAPHSDFNSNSSYKTVGTLKNQDLLSMSGNAVLTIQTNGDNHVELHLISGTSFGATHDLPGLKGHELGLWTTIDKDASGVTHVFTESSFATPGYALEEQSTFNGTHWSGRTDLGYAIASDFFNVSLDSTGSGLVVGTSPDADARGYPVLADQSVTFSLSKSTITKGHKVTGKGKVTVAAVGRKIELQVEKSGRWYDVKSTHEKAGGKFSFTIKGTSIGSKRYRAVASDRAGYVQFGYSGARTLHVT